MKKHNLGIVLSGGSVRGAGHIGFLKRLEELGQRPDIIAGTSAGAMIGAFYAAGKSSVEMLDFFLSTPMFRYKSLNPLKAGIFDTEKYELYFRKYLPDTFEELEIPLIICATNLETGEPRYFNSGDLYKPLLASCAIPLVFSPMHIDDELYVDGGVVDNFPVEQIRDECEKVIGCYLGKPAILEQKQVNTKFKISTRASELLLHSSVKHKFKMTDFILHLPLEKYSYFNQKKMKGMCEEGYKYTKEKLNQEEIEQLKLMSVT